MYFSFKDRYNVPTPKAIKKFSDAVISAVGFGAVSTGLSGYPKICATLAMLGVLFTFLSNLCCEDKNA